MILLVGSSAQAQGDLLSFLDEVGFSVRVFADGASLQGAVESCSLILVEEQAQLQALRCYLPEVPRVLLLKDGEEPYADNEGVFAYLQEPYRWSEVLLLLHRVLPLEAEIHSEIQVGDWIDFSLSSNRAIFQSMRLFLRHLMLHSSLPSDQVHHIHHSICEILMNAMEHGNRFDPRKRVKGSYVLFQDRLVVKIEDQGCGFFPDQIPNPLEHPAEVAETRKRQGKRPGGYGLALASRWMTLDFSDRGNTALLTRVF